jgi:hypothetical protein
VKPAHPATNSRGGSAFFWIVALVLGLLSQPGGSLVTEPQLGDWRIWRLSPFLCGLEALAILIALGSSRIQARELQKAGLSPTGDANQRARVHADGREDDRAARRDEAAG